MDLTPDMSWWSHCHYLTELAVVPVTSFRWFRRLEGRGLPTGVNGQMLCSQVYPTATRALGLGTCSGMARVGALITPFIAQVKPFSWGTRHTMVTENLLFFSARAKPRVICAWGAGGGLCCLFLEFWFTSEFPSCHMIGDKRPSSRLLAGWHS